MWMQLICGLLFLYHFRKHLFHDPLLHLSSHFAALFSVAKRLEKVNRGCKVHVALRIPDPDSASRRSIDLILVTDKEAVVICVKNVSGLVSIDKDGNWVCLDEKHRKTHHLPNPVSEMKQLVGILEEYLEQRGVSLPRGYISYKIICSNPDFRSVNSDSFPPEVITYDQYMQLKPWEKISYSYSGWIKDTLLGGKKGMQESLNEKLNTVLRTAPFWDRLELKDNKYILGEFLEFKGSSKDLIALRKIKRSKVSHVTVLKTSVFGFADSTVEILYTPRDYHIEVPSWSSEYEQVKVGSCTELVFLPQNSTKSFKINVSSIISLSLSA